ncbi:MAG: hypothetical protein R3B74_05975 [Nitrospirales bacterium]|nr:hypothetical protein [Nitrospirales bacterium]
MKTRMHLLINLRRGSYERVPITSDTYRDRYLDHAYLILPVQETFQDECGQQVVKEK